MKKLLLTLATLLTAFAAMAQCNPQFTWTQAGTPGAPYLVSFTNTSTFPGTAPQYVNSSRIYFGDNTVAYNVSTVNHNYPGPGTYNAKLVIASFDSITGNAVCQDTLLQQIVVDNAPCYSTITTTPLGNGQYTFSANTPSGSTGATYTWSFGDGSPIANGSPVSHTFAGNGYYMVSLTTVKDSCVHFAIDSLLVTSVPVNMCDSLQAYMGITNAGPLTRNFQNQSSAIAGLSNHAQWYFGDGGTSISNNPSHTYASGGTYTVFLINTWRDSITNAVVCVDSIAQPVTLGNSNICDSLQAYIGVTVAGPLTRNFQNLSSAIAGLSNHAQWYFGDGGTSISNNPSHTYASGGTYTVFLINTWRDSITNAVVCTDSVAQPVTITGASTICDSLNAYMQITQTAPLSLSFQNTSSDISGLTKNAQWYFGDGGYASINNPSHTYASIGTYNIILINTWKDSFTNAVVCADTVIQPYTFTTAPNQISGYIYWDSVSTAPSFDSFKVWLIKFDSTTNMLTATDSLLTAGFGASASYVFGPQPAGIYMVKAASLLSVPGTTGLVPTYHTSSLTWNTATQFAHTGSMTVNKNIWMLVGTVTSGPGFIGGNVNLGAGRGTTTGVPNMAIFLRKSNNELVTMTYTDANGDFKFEHLPLGAYSVYPEEINYMTTPAPVMIGDGQTNIIGINFEKTETEILPKNITGVKDINAFRDVKVYPNPFRDQITIDNQAGHYNQIAFITVTGQVADQQQIKQGSNVVSTTGLVPGVYFLLINGKDQTGRMTITKQ